VCVLLVEERKGHELGVVLALFIFIVFGSRGLLRETNKNK